MNITNRAIALAVGLCMGLTTLAHTLAHAAESPRPSITEQQVPTNKEELEAVEVAREALARALYVPAGTLPVLAIEKQSWPNSGLGCASPDTATLNISRRGYAVKLATPDGVRHVHVAGRQSRICDLPSKPGAEAVASATEVLDPPPSYDLKAVVERSREDLARRLHVPPTAVRLVSFTAATWPDNTMNCAVPYEQIRKKTVRGYQIQLQKGDRTYVYHTDLVRTRACPSIETASAAVISHNYEVSAKPSAAPADKKRTASSKKRTADASTSPSYLGIVQRYPAP
jgi:hypothetical protein